VIDAAVDATDSVQADLDRIGGRKADLSGCVPLRAVYAAQRAHRAADALEPEQDMRRGWRWKASATKDAIAVLDAAGERDVA
jgi:hypothetical protein